MEILSDLKLASLVDMRMADRRGYWLMMLITFMALPIRGLLAASGAGLQKRLAEGRRARKR